jgi:hypothetical protein
MAASAVGRRVFFAAALSPDKIGGVERFAAELAHQLAPKGWSLTACFEAVPPPAVREFLLAPGNVAVETMADQPGLGMANSREFLRLMRVHRPEVLLYSLGGAVRWWPLLAMANGVKRRVYYDQTSRTASVMTYRAKPHVQMAMKPLTQSICATQFIKDCSDREGIVPPEKSRVIFSGIDNDN